VKRLLRGEKLEDAIRDKGDYSAARAFGHAFEGFTYIEGLFVQTARETERQGETGDNLCLFGPNLTTISNIRPDSVLVFPPPWAKKDKVIRVDLL